jgi:hypothetical protein
MAQVVEQHKALSSKVTITPLPHDTHKKRLDACDSGL